MNEGTNKHYQPQKRQKTHDNSSLIRIGFFRFNKLREQFQLII